MFPSIDISVSGLQPDTMYNISMEINPFDSFRYKYSLTEWVSVGNADTICEDKLTYLHPHSPAEGKFWMSMKISFQKLRVTNNKNQQKGQVSVLKSVKEGFM